MSFMNKKIYIASFLILIIGCSRENPVGYVGQPVVVKIDLPDDSQDLEFIWELTSIPDNSYLNNSDIQAGGDIYSVKFIPDVTGEFSLEASVFQYNDEVETQSFIFNIVEAIVSEETNIYEDDYSALDTLAVSELLSDNEMNWYENDDVDQYLSSANLDSSSSNELTKTVESKEKKVAPSPSKKKKKIKKQFNGQSIPFDSNRFTIQIASKKQLEDAKKVAAKLIEAGYDAYIQKAFFKETNEVWFRIRVGSYDNRDTATAVAKSLSKSRREKAWVDFVRYEN